VTISNPESVPSNATGVILEIRSSRKHFLNELDDVREPLGVISQRSEELRLYNLV
jgi:hypothetical protein